MMENGGMIIKMENDHIIIIMEIDLKEWQDNKKKGKGTFFFLKSGNKRTGEFLDDKEIGEHITYYPDGKITKQNY